MRARVRRTALNLAAIALGLLLCELVLQGLVAFSPAIAFRLRPYEQRLIVDGMALTATREIVPDPVLGYRFSPYSGRFDRWGYRNPSVPVRCDVIALGDSMTFGHDVAANEAWPPVLSRLGHFCAYNAGVGGYGPAEYQVVLEETLRLRPKVIVVGLFLGNDVHDAFRASYLRVGEPFKRLRNVDPVVVARMAQLEQHESLWDRTLRLLGASSGPVPSAARETSLRQWFADHSKLYAFAREIRHTLNAALQTAHGDAPAVEGEKDLETFETSSAKPHRMPWSRDPRLRTVFAEPEITAISIDLDDPRIREGERITEAVLVAIRDRLARVGVDLVVLVIPTKESAYAQVVDPERDGLRPSARDLLAMEDRLRQEIIAFLEGARITYVDALPPLRALLANGVMPFNSSDDGHPNATGQEAIARALLPVVGNRLAEPRPNPAPSPPSAANAHGVAPKAR